MVWWHVIVYFLIAVLAGLGVGSGGLLVAFLTLVSDIPQGRAAGTNLIFFVAALASSVAVGLKNRKISRRFIVSVIPAGALGALSGSALSFFAPADFVKGVFGVFMIAAGIGTLAQAANSIYGRKRDKRKIK